MFFGKRIRLFRLLGFDLKIDLSWVFLAFLITWTLATGWFPANYEAFSTATYWWMGVAGALGLFFSIIFHELAHSIVARRYGIQVRGITLFIFGGVAEMIEEPPNAKSEFLMAVAGPVASMLLAFGFYGVHLLFAGQVWMKAINAVLIYLAGINLLLAIFNLVPAFPLDGGRVLRSALWRWKNNLRWATRLASRIGSGFGIMLIALGGFTFLSGRFIGGAWWVLIGMFLLHASKMSYQQLLLRKALEGESIERFMRSDPVVVSPSMAVGDFVEDYLYKYHHKMFPVIDESKLVGCVKTQHIKGIPQKEWNEHTVGEIMTRCSADNTITSEADAIKALSNMKRTGNSRLMVVENSHLVGVIALKDMLNFLAVKIDLDEQVMN